MTAKKTLRRLRRYTIILPRAMPPQNIGHILFDACRRVTLVLSLFAAPHDASPLFSLLVIVIRERRSISSMPIDDLYIDDAKSAMIDDDARHFMER